MRTRSSWLVLALVVALLAVIPFSIAQHHGWQEWRPAPAGAADPHDTIIATTVESAGPPSTALAPRETSRVSFAVKFKDEVSPYPVLGMFVMPGETVPLEVVLADSLARYTVDAGDGALVRLGPERWRWTAPKRKGVYAVVVRDSAAGETVTLNAFVLVPRPVGTTLDGYRIGRYERRPLGGNPSYARPAGLVEVTEANRGTFVAPHFTLGQFVSKQPGGFPKYLVLRERLLLKLEMLLEEAKRVGLPVTTFQILSGYRTPYYHQSIGNETRYSRHLYGDAADIYVDEDGDGSMDDLDGDGRESLDDAQVLAAVVERLSHSSWYQPFEGGLGLYRANAAHGPFLHVDVRGHRARWGP